MNITRDDMIAAARILVAHENGKRYVPSDIRELLKKIAGDLAVIARGV